MWFKRAPLEGRVRLSHAATRRCPDCVRVQSWRIRGRVMAPISQVIALPRRNRSMGSRKTRSDCLRIVTPNDVGNRQGRYNESIERMRKDFIVLHAHHHMHLREREICDASTDQNAALLQQKRAAMQTVFTYG